MCVGIVQQLKKALVDGVFSKVHQKERYHVFDEVRDVLHMANPMLGLIFIEELNLL